MLDDDDLDFVILASPGGGCVSTVIGLIIVCAVWYFVSQNKHECSELHCDHGTSQLLSHQCLCVEKAKEISP